MWEIQRENRLKSMLLAGALGAILILGCTLLGLLVSQSLAGAVIGAAAGFVVWLIAVMVTVYAGDKIILHSSGVIPADPVRHRVFYNVTEEMAIATGLPMPKLYVIHDSAPNAFTTGRSPETAIVVATTGLLDKLNRYELQAVIGHEMSHIRNRDVLYMMLCGVMLGMVVLIADSIRHSLRHSRSFGGRGGRQHPAAALVVVVLLVLFSILAPLVARILFFAISRKREFLADACAAEATRYPDALADALEKISGDNEVLEAANRATSGMFIVNPIKRFEARANSIFSTHPPVKDRVLILRAMGRGGDASLLAYNNLYRQLSSLHSKKLVPKSALKATPVPLFSPGERAKSPADIRSQQLERLKSIQNLVIMALAGSQLACRCGFTVDRSRFETLSAKAAAQDPDQLGVVSCPSCASPLLGPGELMSDYVSSRAVVAPTKPAAATTQSKPVEEIKTTGAFDSTDESPPPLRPDGTVIPLKRKQDM